MAPPRVALVAGEASGDHLGGALIGAIERLRPGGTYFGVGGPEMEAHGFVSRFAMSDIAVMGLFHILRQYPRLRRRGLEAVEAIVEGAPDVLVIIDCPEFSHRVARRVRARLPDLPIIDYVAPSVWAWRPGRARKMRRYVDEVMALLPFEPEAYERLGGPRCRYVGHPAGEARPPDAATLERVRAAIGVEGRPILAVMPGSRHSELSRLCEPFGEAVAILAAGEQAPAFVIPTLPHLAGEIESRTAGWAVRPPIITDPPGRRAVLHLADAAIVASGTATLELALARTPMVVAYKLDRLAQEGMRFFFLAETIVLANLVHGGRPIVELLQKECNGARLAAEVAPLLADTEARRRQMAALEEVIAKVSEDGIAASERAARIVIETLDRVRPPAGA